MKTGDLVKHRYKDMIWLDPGDDDPEKDFTLEWGKEQLGIVLGFTLYDDPGPDFGPENYVKVLIPSGIGWIWESQLQIMGAVPK